MNNTINPSDRPGAYVMADEQHAESVQIDYELLQLPSLINALSRVLSVPEISKPLDVTIDLVSDYGLRACFYMAGRQWGYVVLRAPGDGSIAIEADTVIQDLEHRSPSQFHVDDFNCAAAWIRNLGLTLAKLDQSWGCTQVDEATKARQQRLKAK